MGRSSPTRRSLAGHRTTPSPAGRLRPAGPGPARTAAPVTSTPSRPRGTSNSRMPWSTSRSEVGQVIRRHGSRLGPRSSGRPRRRRRRRPVIGEPPPGHLPFLVPLVEPGVELLLHRDADRVVAGHVLGAALAGSGPRGRRARRCGRTCPPAGCRCRRHRQLADQSDQHTGQAPVDRPVGERGHRQRLDVPVEGGVEVLEGLVVRQVARPGPVEHREDQARRAPPDAAGRLDVLGGGLRLAGDDHEAEPGHVHPDRDHVGGQQHVDGPPLALRPVRDERHRQLVEDVRNLGGRQPRGELLEAAGRTGGPARAPRPGSSRADTSSSTRRRMPPRSRRLLKYPTSVMYGSVIGFLPYFSCSFCAAPSTETYTRISVDFIRAPCAQIPT